MFPDKVTTRWRTGWRRLAPAVLGVALALVAPAFHGEAQESARPVPGQADPRVGLKPGVRDAGTAARNLELVASVPKPEGFFDPRLPAGEPTPPESPAGETTPPAAAAPVPAPAPAPPAASGAGGLRFANSDMAFTQRIG